VAPVHRVIPSASWPSSWQASYAYDLLEIYGDAGNLGYSYAYAARRDETFRLITSNLQAPSRVLDVAAAQGNFSLMLAEQGYDVTWNDLRAEISDYVKLKRQSGTIQFSPGNILDLDSVDQFDLVLATEVIEHVAHPDEFLVALSEFVRPGGYLVLTTPNGAYFRNQLPKFSDCREPAVFEAEQFKPDADGHIFLIHPDEMDFLATRAGLVVKELRLLGNALTSGQFRTATILRYVPSAWIDRLEHWTQGSPTPLRLFINTEMAVLMQKPEIEILEQTGP
jgi:2-polyprenyl-3-methyl-5-hydroxy-6-metoxy-1,4-benzoquinol methylase